MSLQRVFYCLFSSRTGQDNSQVTISPSGTKNDHPGCSFGLALRIPSIIGCRRVGLPIATTPNQASRIHQPRSIMRWLPRGVDPILISKASYSRPLNHFILPGQTISQVAQPQVCSEPSRKGNWKQPTSNPVRQVSTLARSLLA